MSARVGTKWTSKGRNDRIDAMVIRERLTPEDCSECGRRASVVWPDVEGRQSSWWCMACGGGRSLGA